MEFGFESLSNRPLVNEQGDIVLDRESFMPYEVFTSSEDLAISTEGFIQNIIDWWNRKKKEREARRRAKAKSDWQNMLDNFFDSYGRWLNSLDEKKIKDMEYQGLSFDEYIKIGEATLKALKVFVNLDPLSYKNLLAMVNDEKKASTPKIWKFDEEGVELLKFGKTKLHVFKGSKFDNEASIKKMHKLIMDIDNACWDFYEKADAHIDKFNARCKQMSGNEYNTKKKCILAYLNIAYFVADKSVSFEKQICAIMNSI